MRNSGNRPILILRFSALGDVAMTIPVIYSVAEANPERKFIVVTTPFFSKLFLGRPGNVEVLPVAIRDVKGVHGWRELISQLGVLKPAAIADLHNVSRTWIIDTWFRLRGLRVVMVDKKRSERKRAMKEKLPQESFISRYLSVFGKLGMMMPRIEAAPSGINYPPALPFRKLDLNGIPAPLKISKNGVGIAPYARYYTKTLPEPELLRLIEDLIAKGKKVYLFGGRGEEANKLEEIAGKYADCESLAGKYPIEEELRIMSELELMISMDSANQHLAALTGTRVITIWGGTSPLCGFVPYGSKPQDSICKGLDCQPCSVAGTPQCPLSTLACLHDLDFKPILSK